MLHGIMIEINEKEDVTDHQIVTCINDSAPVPANDFGVHPSQYLKFASVTAQLQLKIENRRFQNDGNESI